MSNHTPSEARCAYIVGMYRWIHAYNYIVAIIIGYIYIDNENLLAKCYNDMQCLAEQKSITTWQLMLSQ